MKEKKSISHPRDHLALKTSQRELFLYCHDPSSVSGNLLFLGIIILPELTVLDSASTVVAGVLAILGDSSDSDLTASAESSALEASRPLA